MSRNNKRKNKKTIIVIGSFILIFLFSPLLKFISENFNFFLIIGIIILIIFLLNKYIKFNEKKKKILKYEDTPYYKSTLIPYDVINDNLGLQYEMKIFNKLIKTFPDSIVMTNLLIPRVGSVNEYSEIDIIFLHKTGLYVLELKNYTGYVYGNLSNKKWTVVYEKSDNLYDESNRFIYEFVNPVLQNKKHVQDLKKHIDKNFISYIIFNTTTKIDSNIDNLSYIGKFIETVKQKETIYTRYEIEEIKDKINSINSYENIDSHIERVKYNDSKYSDYSKKFR